MDKEELVVMVNLDKTGIRASQLVEIREPGSVRLNDRGKLTGVSKIQMSPVDAIELYRQLSERLKEWHLL
jgi:hypothetical protein